MVSILEYSAVKNIQIYSKYAIKDVHLDIMTSKMIKKRTISIKLHSH